MMICIWKSCKHMMLLLMNYLLPPHSAPIAPPTVVSPSLVLSLSPMFDSRDLFPPKEISPPKDIETPVESPIPISPSSSVGSSSPVRSTTPPPDYQEMIRRGFVFEERPNEAIDVPVKDEEPFKPRGSPHDA
ncbi:hypothetical protein Tco_1562132 [Tanacetum coccineum]